MKIGNNSNLNFTANMYIDKSVKDTRRWHCIANDVQEKTKTSPEYEIRLFQEGDKFEIYVDRGRRDDLTTREFLLTEYGSKALTNLSDQQVTQKIKKMLNLVKAYDKAYDNLPDDIGKLERKYGVELSQNSYDSVSDAVYTAVARDAFNKMYDDAVLSDAKTSVAKAFYC